MILKNQMEMVVYQCKICKELFLSSEDDKPDCPHCSSSSKGHLVIVILHYTLTNREEALKKMSLFEK